MLTDAQIERFSRHILLPQVGGRGQERLLAARVRLLGHGRAAAVAADLLARAGVSAVGTDVGAADVTVVVEDAPPLAPASPARGTDGSPLVHARVAGSAGAVATVVRRPCGRCAPPLDLEPSVASVALLGDAVAQALGALAAGEVIGVLTGTVSEGRVQAFDLGAGRFRASRLANRGCAHCGGDA